MCIPEQLSNTNNTQVNLPIIGNITSNFRGTDRLSLICWCWRISACGQQSLLYRSAIAYVRPAKVAVQVSNRWRATSNRCCTGQQPLTCGQQSLLYRKQSLTCGQQSLLYRSAIAYVRPAIVAVQVSNRLRAVRNIRRAVRNLCRANRNLYRANRNLCRATLISAVRTGINAVRTGIGLICTTCYECTLLRYCFVLLVVWIII